MIRNPNAPGIAIFSQEWFDIIFDGTKFNDPHLEHIRFAAEDICEAFQLGDTSDPLNVAEKILNWHREEVIPTNKENVNDQSASTGDQV